MLRILAIALVLVCAATSAEARRHHRHWGRGYEQHRTTTDDERAARQGYARGRIGNDRTTVGQGPGGLVPAGWKLDTPDPNWKGYRYRSPEGDAFLAFSSTSIQQEPVEQHWKAFAFRPDEDPTYLERGNDWVIASSTARDRISYRKAVLDCHEQMWRTVELEFPAAAKASYDAIMARLHDAPNFDPSGQCDGAAPRQ